VASVAREVGSRKSHRKEPSVAQSSKKDKREKKQTTNEGRNIGWKNQSWGGSNKVVVVLVLAAGKMGQGTKDRKTQPNLVKVAIKKEAGG